MPKTGSRLDHLQRLIELTRLERHEAKALNWQAVSRASKDKAGLLASLEGEQAALTTQEQALAEKIRRETRRNACFFSFALEWVQGSLDRVQGPAAPLAYGHSGDMIQRRGSGGLVRGKV